MAEKSTIARPYAEAVFALAKEQSQLNQWVDIWQTAAIVTMNDDMQAMISNTNVDKGQLANLILDVCGSKFSTEGKNLIKLLAFDFVHGGNKNTALLLIIKILNPGVIQIFQPVNPVFVLFLLVEYVYNFGYQ